MKYISSARNKKIGKSVNIIFKLKAPHVLQILITLFSHTLFKLINQTWKHHFQIQSKN